MSAVNEVSLLIAGYCINALWQVPLLTFVAWLATKLLERLGPVVQHSIWVVVLFVSVLVPASSISVHLAENPQNVGAAKIIFTQQQANIYKSSIPWSRTLFFRPEVYFALAAGYILLTAYWFGRFSWSLSKTRKLRYQAKQLFLEHDLTELWSRSCKAFSLGTTRILTSSSLSGPITVGWRNPALIIPPGFLSDCSSEELISAFAHECAHIRRHDFLLNLIYEAATLPIAFHPCTWILKTKVAETRELICDARAAEKLGDASGYARSLLRLATTIYSKPVLPTPHGVGMFDANVLEKRVMNLVQKKAALGTMKRAAILLPSSLILLLGCTAAYALAFNIEKQGSGTDRTVEQEQTSTGRIYQIGEDGVTAPQLVYSVDPQFPLSERKKDKKEKRISGTCLIGFIVDTNGIPQQLHIVRSLSPDFDKESLSAVAKYRFKPAMLEGKPVPVQISVEASFRIY